MQPLTQEGIFRGEIIQFGLNERDTGSVSLDIKARIDEAWNGEDWEDWRQYECFVDGYLNVIKKDGTVNKVQYESIASATGWDGDTVAVANGSWEPQPCQFTVKANVNPNNGQTSYRIEWLNRYDRTPGGKGNVDEGKAKALLAKYGANFRALNGNIARNSREGSQPAGRPAKPATQPRTQKPAPPKVANEDIPF